MYNYNIIQSDSPNTNTFFLTEIPTTVVLFFTSAKIKNPYFN